MKSKWVMAMARLLSVAVLVLSQADCRREPPKNRGGGSAKEYEWQPTGLDDRSGAMPLPVATGGKWGYVDRRGNLVVQLEYEDARHFANGLGVVSKRGLWGAVDACGELRIPLRYDELEPGDGRWTFRRGGQWGFVDTGGAETVVNCAGLLGVARYGLARFQTRVRPRGVASHGERWGFVDAGGRIIIEPIYDAAQDFGMPNLAAVQRNGKWALIDRAGKLVTSHSFDRISCSKYGIFARSDGFWSLLSARGEVLAGRLEKIDLASVSRHEQPRYYIAAQDGKRGYLSEDGRWVIPPRYEWVAMIGDGLAPVWVDRQVRFITLDGKVVLRTQAGAVGGGFSHGLVALVYLDDRVEYVDRTGKVILGPYENARFGTPFRTGLASVTWANGSQVIINRRGDVLLRIGGESDEIMATRDRAGLVRVTARDGSFQTYIQPDGSLLWEPKEWGEDR